jgi:hypothetical protein
VRVCSYALGATYHPGTDGPSSSLKSSSVLDSLSLAAKFIVKMPSSATGSAFFLRRCGVVTFRAADLGGVIRLTEVKSTAPPHGEKGVDGGLKYNEARILLMVSAVWTSHL